MHSSTISDQTAYTGTAPALRYDGTSPLTGIPSRNDIVAEFDNGMTAILQQSLSGKQPIHFMPTEISDDIEGYSSYILRITGSLINGQKAVVNITGIRPFFDVEVPENHSPSSLKIILARILSVTLKNTTKFGFENIRAFLLQGYHTEKKSYIRVRTWNHYDRINALKAVRAVGMSLLRDRTLVLTWDIETYSSLRLGFNDSQYDWRFIVEKAKKLGILEWMYNQMSLKPSSLEKITKWQYQYNAIKVNDRDFHSKHLKIPGAWREGKLTSTISCKQTETGKYPGAYVYPPIKGLENKRPRAESLKRSGKKLHEISFKFNGRDILAWSIQHNNLPEEKGLYAIVLEHLSSKRNEMKKRLAPLKEKKEDMDLVIGLMEKHEFMAEYDSVCFDCSCSDAKQYALKVYMNTFYGEAGNSISPFYILELAGGVTSAGQRNLKLVADFVKSRGFQIKYGDTDSLYLVCPEGCFQECDEAYDGGNGISKEEYWSRMER
ncbi:hypothetical protein C1645_836155 [Glomus cerebriforme]|uniref:DNA polymerase n=1 Tax=Glomus cerebriforme TaxID=658196 RepID=A0A397SAQ1_9GLOM|nr:hypothetical protein C1645_836155 [Glomus cerebriforme]